MKYLLAVGLCVSFGAVSGLFLRPRFRTVWYSLIMKGFMAGICFSGALWLTTFKGVGWFLMVIAGGAASIASFIYLAYIVGEVRLHNAAFDEHLSKKTSSDS
jgi:hypothetical protein